jgi:hypothetical protein
MKNDLKDKPVQLFDFLADGGEWLLSYLSPKTGFARKPIKEWGIYNAKFQVGDKIRLNANPFDEQVLEEAILYSFIKDQVHTVTQTKRTNEYGTTGQWIRTDLMPDWVDATWFDKI